jgi:MraZ protein
VVTGLYGRYEKTLDSKNRVIVPNVFRKRLKDEELILVSWADRCLALFPASRFEEIAADIQRSQRYTKEARAMRRQLFSSAFSVEFDSQGRISVPEHLLQYGFMNFSKDLVLTGDYDKVEIWPRSRFYEMDEKSRVNFDEFFEKNLSAPVPEERAAAPEADSEDEQEGADS